MKESEHFGNDSAVKCVCVCLGGEMDACNFNLVLWN
jgi:hypothetical protein